MHSRAHGKQRFFGAGKPVPARPPMLLNYLFMAVFPLILSVSGQAQAITLALENARLETIFREIEKQTPYRFVFTKENLDGTRPVSLNVVQATLKKVMDYCIAGQPLTYSISDAIVMIKQKPLQKGAVAVRSPQRTITGQVVTETGDALPGATVALKREEGATMTDAGGNFSITAAAENPTLLISSVGYARREVAVSGSEAVRVTLYRLVSMLDETVVIAYGTTTRRLNTGSVAKVTAEEISKQPVSNPLAALQGRVPGLLVTQTNGVPGSAFKIQLRGQSSIGILPGVLPPTDPLIIIDGVPFAPNNDGLGQLFSAAGSGGLSPLNMINPADIESIEVLKDADATAIYGSRGANGVLVITTKKGRAGKTSVQLTVTTGLQKAPNTLQLLNTAQYVAMRREALANDGLVPDQFNAPDLLLWDTVRYTDWKKQFIGSTATSTDAQLSLSGGSATTQFLVGTGFNRQTTVFPGDFSFSRGSFNFNVRHATPGQRLKLNLTALYTAMVNTIPGQDFTDKVRLAPNAPPLYDSTGMLLWQYNGLRFVNPLAYLRNEYNATTDNLLGNLQLHYLLAPGLTLQSSFGYNVVATTERSIIPIAAQDPAYHPEGFADFGRSGLKSWIAEPQLSYTRTEGRNNVALLLGGTWQANNMEKTALSGTGYASDALLRSIEAAPVVRATNSAARYHYAALFGRFTYNRNDRYILNLSGRRDGSSRFGPGKQFSMFGAAGAAWIFSNEPRIRKAVPFLSFGKLRGSYGTTGNDQIGDYQYLDLWRPFTGGTPYENVPAVTPSHLFNADFRWELNRKLEGALDLGFMQDRLFLSVAYTRHRSSNQLLAYTLPTQTGFTSLNAKNFPALVQNTGWEFSLTSQNIATSAFTWKTTLNVTVPRNKLLSFPNLAASSYASSLREGKPLSILSLFRSGGVDPKTGLFSVEDLDKDSSITEQDFLFTEDAAPRCYGGITNTVAYKGLELYVLVEGRKQKGFSILRDLYGSPRPPGVISDNMWSNQPVAVLDRWQHSGDQTTIQQFTATPGSAAYATIANYTNSTAILTDASYLRLKTLALSYSVPAGRLQKWRLANCRIYLQAQNLFTLTPFEGSDPETQNVFALPPLKAVTAGVQLSF